MASPTPSNGNAESASRTNIQVVTVNTALGPVDVMYDLQPEGDTLHLKGLAVYARQSEPLRGVLRELLGARSLIAQYAKEAGYNKLRITGGRTLQSSSGNPGKPIDVTIDLRDR